MPRTTQRAQHKSVATHEVQKRKAVVWGGRVSFMNEGHETGDG